MKKESYYISVGEPWDFESPDGSNIIMGHILCVLSRNCLVFKSNHILDFGDKKGYILILSPRHKGNDFSNLQDGYVVVNGGLLRKEYYTGLDEDELMKNSKFEIVGSVRKI